jgi:hypothetical protein
MMMRTKTWWPIFLGLFLCPLFLEAQIYELKDHRPDTAKAVQLLYDTVPQMADSIWPLLVKEDYESFAKYTPSYEYLATTFDSMQISNNPGVILVKQRYILHNLQKQFFRLKKDAAKSKVKLKFLELDSTSYLYGLNQEGHPFAYVTYYCKRNNKRYHIRFLAIKIMDYWFMGDELEWRGEAIDPLEKFRKELKKR